MNWMMQRKSDHPIYQLLGLETKNFLEKDPEIIEYLDNSRDLIENSRNLPQLIDYSPLVVPAFKGLERWFFLIAPGLGIPLERIEKIKINNQGFGSVVRENELEFFFDKILETISEKEEIKKDLKVEIQSLKSFLKNYRHEVAHCWKKLETPIDANLHFMSVIAGIRRITEKLLESKILN